MTAATSTVRARYRRPMTTTPASRWRGPSPRRLVTCVCGWGRSPRCGVSWAVDEFVASLRGRAAHTAEAYERDVRQFVAWAERGGCPSTRRRSTTPTLRRYLAYLDDAQVRPPLHRPQGGVAAGIPALPPPPRRHHDRSRPDAAGAEGRGATAPGASPGRSRRPARRRLRRAELAGRPDAAGAAMAWRDLAVLEVLYGAGLRVERVLRALARRLRSRPRARDRARQGPKVRRVPLGEPALAAIRGYLAHGRPELVTELTPPDARVPQRAWAGAHHRDARRIVAAPSVARRPGAPPARAPARLRDASARAGCRPARRPGAPRPHRPRHHADLHALDPRAPPRGLRRHASPCLTSHSRRRRSPRSGATTSSTDASDARERLILHYSPLVKFVAGRVASGLAAEHRAGRSRELRDLRPHRRHREVRSRPRIQVRDVRDLAHQGRDHRRAALHRLGAALGPREGACDRARVLEARERASAHARRQRARRTSSGSASRSSTTALSQISFVGLVALDEILAAGERATGSATVGDTVADRPMTRSRRSRSTR